MISGICLKIIWKGEMGVYADEAALHTGWILVLR